MLRLVAVDLDGAEFGEEVGVFGGEVEEAGFEEDAEVGEEGAARNVAAVGVAAGGDGDGDEFGVEVRADDEFGEGGAGTGGVDEEDLFGGGEAVEEVAEDGDEADVFEAEGEALCVMDAEAGFGEVDEVSVVEFAGEFEFGFEDNEGGVVASLAEVEAEVVVGAMRAEGLPGWSEVQRHRGLSPRMDWMEGSMAASMRSRAKAVEEVPANWQKYSWRKAASPRRKRSESRNSGVMRGHSEAGTLKREKGAFSSCQSV